MTGNQVSSGDDVSSADPRATQPIGVFDSGIGGLTVLRALRERLPDEHFIYLGDTARLPYGTKSRESVLRYSTQAANFLMSRDVKCVVVACNTAASAAVPQLRAQFGSTPVLGVIEPGVAAGCKASRSGHIAVIGTEGTVQGGAYQRAIAQQRQDSRVTARACSLFVALAEEGWTEGPIVEAVAHRYLDEMFAADDRLDTLVLGCTHFPVLLGTLRKIVGRGVEIVDSAHTMAEALERELLQSGLISPGRSGSLELLATDGPERFARVGSLFLGQSFAASQVELVDLAPVGEPMVTSRS